MKTCVTERMGPGGASAKRVLGGRATFAATRGMMGTGPEGAGAAARLEAGGGLAGDGRRAAAGGRVGKGLCPRLAAAPLLLLLLPLLPWGAGGGGRSFTAGATAGRFCEVEERGGWEGGCEAFAAAIAELLLPATGFVTTAAERGGRDGAPFSTEGAVDFGRSP